MKFYLIFSCETKNQINKKVVNLGFIARRWRDFIHLTELSIQMKSRNEIDYRYYIHRSYRSLNRPSQGTFIGGGHTAGVNPPTDTRQLKFCLKTLVRKSTGLRNSVKWMKSRRRLTINPRFTTDYTRRVFNEDAGRILI